jgi:hypothetical protein
MRGDSVAERTGGEFDDERAGSGGRHGFGFQHQTSRLAGGGAGAPPVSGAADDAVATDLPAHQSVGAADASARAHNDPQGSAADTSQHVILDRNAGATVWQVVDNRTSLVVKQFPDQGFLRRRAYARALEQAREDARALRIDRKI